MSVAGRLAHRQRSARARRDVPIGPLTTYRVGGRAALFVAIDDEDDLAAAAESCRTERWPVLVVGKGSNLLVADAGFAGLAVVLGDGVRRGRRSTAPTVRGRGRGRAPGRGAAHRGRGPDRVRVGGRRAGLDRRRRAHERRRPRLGHGRDAAEGPRRRPAPGRMSGWRRPRLDLAYRHSVDQPVAGRGAAPSSRSQRGDAARGRGDDRDDRALAAGEPARRPERRLGVHQPARRLRRPAHRRRRLQGPAASAPRSVSDKHANFFIADDGGRPTTSSR